MGYTVLTTELGFSSTKDVTMVDTTWIDLELRGSDVATYVNEETLAWTLRSIADAIENDEGLADELIVQALEDSLRYAKVTHPLAKKQERGSK